METSLIGSVRRALAKAFPTTLNCDTPNCALAGAGGRLAYKSVQLTNNGATHQNLFVITGAIRGLQIYGIATAVGDSTVFSGVDFDVYDGATATVMTTAVDCSGMAVKDGVAKIASDGSAAVFLDGSAAAYYENATLSKTFFEGMVIESSAGATYIRLGYTGNVTTDVTLTFYVRYQPLTETATLTAV